MKLALKLLGVAALLSTCLAQAQQRPLVQLSDTPQYQQMLRDQQERQQQQEQQRRQDQLMQQQQMQRQQEQSMQQMQQMQQRAGAVYQPRY
jgi:hypothetical protein